MFVATSRGFYGRLNQQKKDWQSVKNLFSVFGGGISYLPVPVLLSAE
jgi:hypothetical protein